MRSPTSTERWSALKTPGTRTIVDPRSEKDFFVRDVMLLGAVCSLIEILEDP